MKIAVFGGIGATAREFAVQAMGAGHYVSWFIHTDDELVDTSLETPAYRDTIRIVRGSSDILAKYQETIAGCDAVVVAFDACCTKPSSWVHQQRLIQTAMRRVSVQRIIAITTHGAGDSQRRLDWSTWAKLNVNQVRYILQGQVDMCWSLVAQYTAQEAVAINGETLEPRESDGGSNSSADSEGENKGTKQPNSQPLRWTILRPGLLTQGPTTGTYLASHDHVFGGYISHGDVADCALKALEEDMDIGECFSVAYSARVA
ncbi:hypothetical protein GGI04_001327 [Coemansia thaxteri]|uniref:NAD(P)-binding domain-containing protein n=1 Tax=Coemansia thaxteri TaxID=2663907 RepID=A0A9W8BHZ2_9FUNG|nr:hypothetical protein H4R26_003466 [Coemansia thaxteri]KAJ2007939.1 hypothetical protein GGI04_001327 [Coemansia thaxteri]KAJ2472980.1 hypothetical protein GGI02_001201 [Coemansia sp. RSA 2322]KAJ2483850.1 hypothetical protein EV174_002826 [Coemansia sp. RSA 2320]